LSDPVYVASLIALSVSIVFGLSNQVQLIALRYMDVRHGTFVNVATSTLLLWLTIPFYLEPQTLLSPSIIWFVLAGLIVPSLSMTLHTLSVQKIGPAITAGLTSTSPIFAMVLAVIIIGETVTDRLIAGTAIVIAGVAIIALRSRGGGDTSWPLWAIAIPLGAAFARGLSHNVVKIGLETLPNPLTAALVGSTTSLLVLSLLNRRHLKNLPTWNRGHAWFAACGLLNGLGLVGLNFALGMGQVVVVSPLVATTPAFTIILGWILFRGEVVRLSTVLAIVVIFAGCLLIMTR